MNTIMHLQVSRRGGPISREFFKREWGEAGVRMIGDATAGFVCEPGKPGG
jgi:hypothetical protein